MELILKRNWDVPISPPTNVPSKNLEDDGFFIGRDMEAELLKNEIKRKSQGSILVSGHRGVGKTTLVYKVLRDLYKEQPLSETKDDGNLVEKKLFVVLINAGQLESITIGNEKKITSETILKTIIRRLYSTGKSFLDGSLKNDLEILYKKAIAKEYKSQENIKQQLETIISEEKKQEQGILLEKFDKNKIIYLISFILGILVIVSKPLGDLFSKLLAMILALPLPFVINYSRTRAKSNQKKNIDSNSAELLYQLDNDVANLEYDLEELHKSLNANGFKVIYVIDELDKLGDITKVAQVIKYSKNLFTLSKAIFIFIGNEDIYQSSTIENDGKSYRPEQYTYFTSKFFISRPTWEELVRFLDNSMEITPSTSKHLCLVQLQHYLAQEAGNDFYNLINLIKNNIQSYNNKGNPVLSINIENPDNIRKSRFHKCQVVVFNKKYYIPAIAKRYENEQLLRELMNYATKIINANPSDTFSDPSDPDNISSMKRDFNTLLLKLEVFSSKVETMQKINGIDVPIRIYNYTGYFKDDPPDRLNILSEYERRFVGLSNKYLELLLPIINEFKKSSTGNSKDPYSLEALQAFAEEGFDVLEPLPFKILLPNKLWQSTLVALSEDPPRNIKTREEIDIQEKELQQLISSIENSLFSLAVLIIKSKTSKELELKDKSQYKILLKISDIEIIKVLNNEGSAVFFDLKRKKDHIIIADTVKLDESIIKKLLKDFNVYFIRSSNENKIYEGTEEIISTKGIHVFTITDTNSLIEQTNRLINEILAKGKTSKFSDVIFPSSNESESQPNKKVKK